MMEKTPLTMTPEPAGKERNYQRIAIPLSIIVREILEIGVPENIITDWKIFGRAVYIIDHELDEIINTYERKDFQKKLEDFLGGKEENFSNEDVQKAMLEIRRLSNNLEPDQRIFLTNSLLRVLRITEEMKLEENPKKLVILNRLEGQAFAKSFLAFLPYEFRQNDRYKKLLHSLTRLGRVANSLDSFLDMPTDYSNRKIRISPLFVNRILFVSAILSDSFEFFKNTNLPPDLIKQLWSNLKANKRDSKNNEL